jgi:hypothetical protein
MSVFENQQVFHACALRRRRLRIGNISTNATTYPWSRTPSCALDTAIANGTHWHQPGFTTYPATSAIATLPSRFTSIFTQGGKLDLPQCDKRQPSAYRTEDLAQD